MIARETFFYHGRSRGVTWKSGREQGELVEGEVCERLAGRDEISWFFFFFFIVVTPYDHFIPTHSKQLCHRVIHAVEP